MKYKTISGHYDTVYSLEHNNRKFIPQNVDYNRVSRNYNCIAAGEEVYVDLENPQCLAEFWERYRELADLYWKDRANGTQFLYQLDTIVKEMAASANDFLAITKELTFEPKPMPRFATLEEIYDKLYEPPFREFQLKQRPCRRYNGTYLQKIREERHEAASVKQQTRNAKIGKTAEAIEIVFGIGDMDNTGYFNAPEDAYKSELLLKDYCDHLMQSENVCFVTTKDLETPGWQPPFKNGLIVLNTTVHCDEATPGIHLTCIPYSRGCKRGPEVQAALGRALTGMGYPSTWKDALDKNGERVPKRDKYGKVIHNADGTIRYKQEPDGQGIIDWIEEQKRWIQKEMERRYGWQREYKGSHPRGNLSTPDYQAVRARERQEEFERQMKATFSAYVMRMDRKLEQLTAATEDVWYNTNEWEKVIRYLKMCPQEEYLEYINRAEDYIATLPQREQARVKKQLQEIIHTAELKALEQSKKKEQSKQEQYR